MAAVHQLLPQQLLWMYAVRHRTNFFGHHGTIPACDSERLHDLELVHGTNSLLCYGCGCADDVYQRWDHLGHGGVACQTHHHWQFVIYTCAQPAQSLQAHLALAAAALTGCPCSRLAPPGRHVMGIELNHRQLAAWVLLLLIQTASSLHDASMQSLHAMRFGSAGQQQQVSIWPSEDHEMALSSVTNTMA
jgi:hypothetical protein